MSLTQLAELPDRSRIWVFEADGSIREEDWRRAASEIEAFLERWTAHGQSLRVGYQLKYGRFLMVAVDEGTTRASGCSIDALTGFVRDLGEQLGVDFLDRSSVSFRTRDGISRVTRQEFGRMAEEGEIDPTTVVFDNTVTSLEAIREGRWEVRAGESWHKSLIPTS